MWVDYQLGHAFICMASKKKNERRQVKREIFCVWNVSLCVLAVAVGMRVFGMFIPRTPGL